MLRELDSPSGMSERLVWKTREGSGTVQQSDVKGRAGIQQSLCLMSKYESD